MDEHINSYSRVYLLSTSIRAVPLPVPSAFVASSLYIPSSAGITGENVMLSLSSDIAGLFVISKDDPTNHEMFSGGTEGVIKKDRVKELGDTATWSDPLTGETVGATKQKIGMKKMVSLHLLVLQMSNA